MAPIAHRNSVQLKNGVIAKKEHPCLESTYDSENDPSSENHDPNDATRLGMPGQKGGKHNSVIKIEDHAYKQLTVVISSKIGQPKKCADKLCDDYDFTFVTQVQGNSGPFLRQF